MHPAGHSVLKQKQILRHDAEAMVKLRRYPRLATNRQAWGILSQNND